MPTISVIVPVYNVEKYIHRCVDSILTQTFTDFELILVDDGSPDNCGAICDEYAQKDSRVKVIHQKNQGQAAARNHALAIARGQWLTFVDSDDVIHPQMLEHLHRVAEDNGVDISMCGAVEEKTLPCAFYGTRTGESVRKTMDERGLEELYDHGEHRYWVVCGKLIRRQIVEKIPFTHGRFYEDNAVAFRWLHAAGAVADIQERYYFYQVNPEGTTKSRFSRKQLDFLWALEEQRRFYKNVGFDRMECHAAVYQLKATSWYLPKVCDELHDRLTAERMRRKMRKLLKAYRPDQLALPSVEYEKIKMQARSLLRRKLGK